MSCRAKMPLEAIVYFPLEGPAKPSSAGLSPFWRLATMQGARGPSSCCQQGESDAALSRAGG